jgi:hypothetical protein
MDVGLAVFLIFISCFFAVVITSIIWDTARDKDVRSIKDQAVAGGYAEWVVTQQGDRVIGPKFTWKNNMKREE